MLQEYSNTERDNTEKLLEELCILLISKLDDLKRRGIIDEVEYSKHTVVKKQFLQYYNICMSDL